ncbi:MAG: pyridoxine 5'-phosphate synthase, partial [Gammaproteobacteria bacterium]|nr:pyridoxine 5'-phosphate synthase [Gammaproteobacteria bacterium]
MAVTEEMLGIALQLRPRFCCLVPERREELTTEGGLDVAGQSAKVGSACERLKAAGIRVSLFIDPEERQLRAASECGAPVVEIHTGRYADAADEETRARELHRIAGSVKSGAALGLQLNAGHGLNYHNVQAIAAIPGIEELNIGHAIIARALFTGLFDAVSEMKLLMREARG